MKLKTIIADDEFFIRKRLLKIISDEVSFIEVVGEAENGKEILDLLDKQDADLIIMDIKMPALSGLDVAEYIYNAGLNIKMIIISGYNDFEYARTALHFGVLEYLSKPIHATQLIHALEKTKEAIETSFRTKRSNQIYLFLQVLQGRASKEEYLELFKVKNELHYQFVSIYFDGADNDILHSLICHIENFNLQSEYIREGDNIFTLFIHAKKSLLKDKFFIKDILRGLLSGHNKFYFAVLSDIFGKEENWREIYLHTLNNLNYRFFNTKPLISSHEELTYSDLKIIGEVRGQLTKLIKSRDFEGLYTYISKFTDRAEQNRNINLLLNFIPW